MKDSIQIYWGNNTACVVKDGKEYLLHGLEIVDISFGDAFPHMKDQSITVKFEYKIVEVS